MCVTRQPYSPNVVEAVREATATFLQTPLARRWGATRQEVILLCMMPRGPEHVKALHASLLNMQEVGERMEEMPDQQRFLLLSNSYLSCGEGGVAIKPSNEYV